MLIYSKGDEAEDILYSFGLSDANQKKYDIVKKRFDDHFIPTRNTIFERARFNRRVQEEGESVDAFITDLYTLAEHCNYKDLRDDLIRDRIVVGIRDSQLSEQMQMDSKLTLASAIALVRQKEAVKSQQKELRGTSPIVGAIQKLGVEKSRSRKNQTCSKCGRSLLMITNSVLHEARFAENARNEVIFRWYADPQLMSVGSSLGN